jgi:hypothetical protein
MRNARIITGLSFYNDLHDLRLGARADRQWLDAYEDFLAHRVFNQQVEIIPRAGETNLHIKIGTEPDRPLFKHGDGISQLIIQTIPLFLHSDKTLMLFIEEPELYLHPGYQRLLIEIFLDSTIGGNRQVFVATHSQQFLDLTLDHKQIAVIRVSKQPAEADDTDPEFSVEVVSNENHQLLQELGVHNSSVLLSNCTIWVEGITDRMYFRHFLHLWRIENLNELQYLEDIHYSFVEYSGSNIKHWSFDGRPSSDGVRVDRIARNVFVIADKDDPKKQKLWHATLRQTLNDRFFALPCREVENLLTPTAIRAVCKHYGDTDLNEFDQEGYRDELLGKFIEDTALKGKTRHRTASYADDSGTIREKTRFAEIAIPAMTSHAELSSDAKALVDQIVSFVGKCNRGLALPKPS